MSEYKVEIEGKEDLLAINQEIAGEEAGASEFVSSVVTPRGGQVTNVLTFRTLPAGTVPKPLKIVKLNDPPPAGTTKVWSGTMITSGTNTAVTGYRQS